MKWRFLANAALTDRTALFACSAPPARTIDPMKEAERLAIVEDIKARADSFAELLTALEQKRSALVPA